MQIGELSARTGATVRMLRYYEEHGLLAPRRSDSGYRHYVESDVDRVARIRCMLASALPTSVVAQALRFLADERPTVPADAEERDRLATILSGELKLLDDRIAALTRSREQLATFLDNVRREIVGPDNPGALPDSDTGPAVRARML